MIEEVFRLGPLSITPFGLSLVAALGVAYWQLTHGLRREGLGDEDEAGTIVFACGLIGIAGGKVYYSLLMLSKGEGFWDHFLSRAGIVWYGCFIAGLLAFLWIVRRLDLPLARTFDAAAPGLALGYSVGRIGCFLVGDDYGVPTDLPWGVAFKVGLPPTTAGVLRREYGIDVPQSVSDGSFVAVHPTQLYETLAAFVIFLVAIRLHRRWRETERPAGGVMMAVIALLSVERFLVEFIRAKDDRILAGYTVAQGISVLVLLVLAAMTWQRRRRAAGENP